MESLSCWVQGQDMPSMAEFPLQDEDIGKKAKKGRKAKKESEPEQSSTAAR